MNVRGYMTCSVSKPYFLRSEVPVSGDGTEQVSATFGQALELELQKRDTVLVF